jgi:hypothetical protein
LIKIFFCIPEVHFEIDDFGIFELRLFMSSSHFIYVKKSILKAKRKKSRRDETTITTGKTCGKQTTKKNPEVGSTNRLQN